MRRLPIVLLVTALSACGGTGGPWQKPSSDTTCEDWLTRMTVAQRAEMAGPLLFNVLEPIAPPGTLTDEALTEDVVRSAADMITGACEGEPGLATVPVVLQRAVQTSVDDLFQDVSDALSEP